MRSFLRQRDALDKDSNGMTDLHRAAQKGEPKPATLAALWQDENAARTIDRYGRVPLHCAAENGHTEIVQALIEMTDVNKKDNFGRTALHWAAENNHSQIVKLLLNAEADTNLQDFSNQTALSRAAWRGWDATVRLLLEHRAAYHLPDQNGKTALDLAVDNGDSTVTELFLTAIMDDKKNGTNEPAVEKVLKSFPNATWRSFYGRIMCWAAQNKHRTVMELLLKKAIQVDDQFEDIGESTALRSTTSESYLETIEFILEFHLRSRWDTRNHREAQDVLQKAFSQLTPDGHIDVVGYLLTPLEWDTREVLSNAAKEERLSIVNHLLEAGAEPAEDTLSGPVEKGHLSIVNSFLEAGAKPTEYLLSIAVEKGHLSIVNRLLEAGAKPTKDGLDTAAFGGNLSIVNRLLEAGAKPSKYTLYEAASSGHLNIVNRLLEAGAKPTEEARSRAAELAAILDGPKALEYSEIENRIREALALEVGE